MRLVLQRRGGGLDFGFLFVSGRSLAIGGLHIFSFECSTVIVGAWNHFGRCAGIAGPYFQLICGWGLR
ncbi:Protein of unknown function [Pyronema omphalodes CBS 100304]|uniref:Uncharacterized protein n=1 Tax=Pyronema omphalodes (strain CBS 100304) TaxID=1076935 RepID=U4LMZ3_PYROM|nr:Protein of unknown function [Pyronema omphalodes CBS 100304]